VSATAGRVGILCLLGEARHRSDLPTTADLEEVIEALQVLGVRRVTAAAKWHPQLMRDVASYLAEAGRETLGHTAEPTLPSRSWPSRRRPALSLQAVPILEGEFDRRVVTNPSPTFWAGLRQFGLRIPVSGWGRLIDELAG
jgi:maleate cis-trans isomerase